MRRAARDGQMKENRHKNLEDILEYQPDAVEIEEKPVPGRVRWVLYLILLTLVLAVAGAVVFKVDRIVVAQGRLITTMPTIVVQPLTTSIVRAIHVRVGDVVEKDQELVTLDATFTGADLSQLRKRRLAIGAQIRRIRAELAGQPFQATLEEGADGRLQEEVLRQRTLILEQSRQSADDKIAALQSKLALHQTQREGKERERKLLRDLEGTTAKRPQNDVDYRLRLLEAQKARTQAASEVDSIQAEEEITANELRQARSEWKRFAAERRGELMEEEVQLRNELGKVEEEIHKAERMHELVSLRAPQRAIVLKLAERSVGSIIQQAEPFLTLVPADSTIEVEADVASRDIGRIRIGDSARVKLDAFPFQRHDTLPGTVRVVSEDSFERNPPDQPQAASRREQEAAVDGSYRIRIGLRSTQLRNVPEGFRLMPGMKVRAEIKVGKRSVISYFLYPVIRALDESLREP